MGRTYHNQTELGESDWLALAEAAYKAYYDHLLHVHSCEPCTWDELDEMDRDGWTEAVKETAEQLKKTSLR